MRMIEGRELVIASIFSFASFVGLSLWLESPARPQPPSAEPTPAAAIDADEVTELNWGLAAIHARPSDPAAASSTKPLIVAIIDTGCDLFHPDLAPWIWTNPGETGTDAHGEDRATNGIDDDANGFIDDVHGWDFATDSPALMDEHGHGTHVAGIVAQTAAPPVRLMILKYYDTSSSGTQNLARTIAAIRYAVTMGARIINYSGGGILRSQMEELALKEASDQGVLLVAAAGNEGLNSDFFHFYPADYDLPNILSVGAFDRDGRLLAHSNFGTSTVDLAAPGKNIYSTLPQARHGYMSGTSQAAAFVTGIATRLMATDAETQTAKSVRDRLMRRGRAVATWSGKIGAGQRLDAKRALLPDTGDTLSAKASLRSSRSPSWVTPAEPRTRSAL